NEKISLESFVTEICDDLGTKISTEKSIYNSTDIQLTLEETARSEIMDVGMDEEGINMMNYQKWYNAIGRMITTMDEALEKLINGTGVVGLR
ncbi:MAG: flagellar hook-associated protein FlgK, partial [Oscillospiraceae bacterium]|nr:flagellar hook-associated protein FlgK [Oscillospiraceae bacterium]